MRKHFNNRPLSFTLLNLLTTYLHPISVPSRLQRDPNRWVPFFSFMTFAPLPRPHSSQKTLVYNQQTIDKTNSFTDTIIFQFPGKRTQQQLPAYSLFYNIEQFDYSKLLPTWRLGNFFQIFEILFVNLCLPVQLLKQNSYLLFSSSFYLYYFAFKKILLK